jgi:hypothetical protein
MIIRDSNRCFFALEWYSGRWGISFTALGGRWGFHFYLDICQASLQLEIGGRKSD